MRFLRRPNKFWTITLVLALALAGLRYGAARLQWHGYVQWRMHQDKQAGLDSMLRMSVRMMRGQPKSEVLDHFRKGFADSKFTVIDGELQSFRDPAEEVAVALYYHEGALYNGSIAWLAEAKPAWWVEPLWDGVVLSDKACYFFFLPFGLIVLLAAIAWKPVRFSGGRVCAVIGLVGLCLWTAMILSGGAFANPIWIAPATVLTFLGLLLYRISRPRPIDPRYCPHCQYDLTGNESGICPECGNATPATERREVEAKLQEAEDRLRSVDDGAE